MKKKSFKHYKNYMLLQPHELLLHGEISSLTGLSYLVTVAELLKREVCRLICQFFISAENSIQYLKKKVVAQLSAYWSQYNSSPKPANPTHPAVLQSSS